MTVSIDDVCRLLRGTRARIYQLIDSGVLEKRESRITLESALIQAFEVRSDSVTYKPLGWRFDVRRPAPLDEWPLCGARAFDGSAAVLTNFVPPELAQEPETAAFIARMALQARSLLRDSREVPPHLPKVDLDDV